MSEDGSQPSGGVSGPFIRRPIATMLLMIAIAFVGIIAYPSLPVAPLPQVDFPTIQVTATLPGASPDTMASSVAQPLETQFAQMPSVTQLTSTSVLGSTSIVIQFDLQRNIDGAANDVQSAINAASGLLPKDLPGPPTYKKVNPADSPVLLLSATSEAMPLTEVSDQVNIKLAQQISQMSGVAQVVIGGQQKPAIRIQIDPARLVNKNLSLEDVRNQLAITTVNIPKGSLDGKERNLTIYANDQLTDAKDWNEAVIAWHNGVPIRVHEVGQAVASAEDVHQRAWANRVPGVFLIIYKQPGANVIETVDRIKEALPRLVAALPPSIKVEVVSDRTQTIRAAIADVQFTLFISIVLVIGVIFVFLRSFWATVIPSLAVPLALLGALAGMWLAGYSLDNLSLMALTISVGFVVDDAIVVLENITRHIEKGETPLNAALKGSEEIGFTIVSISLSLVAVLIPLLLMQGVIGRLFREFAVTLAMTIIFSAIVSLTLTPMMATRFMKSAAESKRSRFFTLTERGFDAMHGAYERALDFALDHQRLTMLTFLITVALTAWLFIIIPKGFFPEQDTGLLTGISEAAQDVSFARMAELQQQLADIVQNDPDVATVASAIGSSAGNPLNNGRMYITLKPRSERSSTASQIIARLRPKLDEVSGARLYLQAAQDVRIGARPSRTLYQYTLQDANIIELTTWSNRILNRLKQLPQLRDVATDQQMEGATLTLNINRDEAARYGFTPQQVDDALYDAFGQRQIAQYFTQTDTYHIILEITPLMQGDPSTLHQIWLKSPLTQTLVPLSSFVSWSTAPVRPLSVSHQGQFPATTISFNLAQGVSLGEATTAIDAAVREMNPPQALLATYAGTAQAFSASLSSVPFLILAALFTVYLILGILYESLIHPLTILSTLPSAGLGALATMMVFGFDFSLMGLIAILLLIGIVKKNGIMMVDFAIEAERTRGLSGHDAIREAALLRFRPIMMTTMAALLGAIPLMLGTGTGSELRQPLGYAMFGGLLVSQALTLLNTPVIYLTLDRLRYRALQMSRSA